MSIMRYWSWASLAFVVNDALRSGNRSIAATISAAMRAAEWCRTGHALLKEVC
ncbi:hypothetical protein AB0H83_50585 [Dactylosporangium sp. NPDC050688]|uniref:hypothetical protein n=1 Tax=Dactylosporangium sp. NPDC050688 TaxID=3157217 RepID=UPI0033CF941D